MKVVLAVVGIVGLIFGFFWFLQWLSDRNYKPSCDNVKRIIQESIDGRLSLTAFDEFSCVRIAYDTRLDLIREKYNKIVNDPAHMGGELTEWNATPLNDAGKNKLRELIHELEQMLT